MQSIATSRALPGPTQESKNRSFWWTREPFIGLAPAAWFFPNLFRITNRQKNEELLMRAIPVILALGSLSAIQPGPGCPIFKEVENTRASRSKKGPQTSIDAGIDAELALLRRIKIRVGQARAGGAATSGLALGIGDDCALLRPRAGEDFAITTDLSLAGRHFRLDWHPAESVGHRTLARGLSDLAAMGARPAAAFLSLGLPAELVRNARAQDFKTKPARNTKAQAWIDRFLDGFLALAAAHGVPLAGGDLAEGPVAVADIVLIGAVRRGKALLRSGARPGDLLYATGRLGAAAAGLARLGELAGARRLQKDEKLETLKIPKRLDAALAAHLYPQPRVAQGLALVRRGLATAAIDLSDGLSTDLHHLCEESGVAAEVDAAALPIAEGATLEQALHGGEDYELLFAAGPDARVPRDLAGVRLTRIGRIVSRGSGRGRSGRPLVTLLGADGARPLPPRGWEHFS
jgi:thiamine-monophosphate kinase